MKILLTVILILFASCGPSAEEIYYDKVVNDKDQDYLGSKIVVIDTCQYLTFPSYRGFGLTHKGNCNNPIHIYSLKNPE